MPKTKRDNTYYLERLEIEAPAIHRDLLAGKFSSPAEAFRAAGLKKPRTRLNELKNAWRKASTSEQQQFFRWLGISGSHAPVATGAAPAIPAPSPRTLGGKSGHLSEETKRKVVAILTRRSIKVGQTMREIGFDPLNASLGTALARGTRVQPELARALDIWIDDNSS